MSFTVPTRGQIAAQVDAVLAREPDAQCIAIHSPSRDAWPDSIALRERCFDLRWCESPLAARELLADAGRRDGLILLTNLTERDLGADVIARLSRARIFEIESWDMVRQAFQAREIDSRLASQGWMASLLLENVPAGGYQPVAGGFLDLDTAWTHVLSVTLGFAVGRPDAPALLRWTMRAENVARFTTLPDPVRPRVLRWVADVSGPVGELVMHCVAAGCGIEALPAGLACGVIFGAEPANAELVAAAVRLERFTGNHRVAPDVGRRWADAAAWVVRNVGQEAALAFLERADGLVQEFQLGGYAAASPLLPSGFEARLDVFAVALAKFIEARSAAMLAAVECAADAVLAHDQAVASAVRTDRVSMALRLCRWLAGEARISSGFAASALAYVREGAFADWARFKLLGGDELAALSSAYGYLAEAARERREQGNRSFADALKNWNASGSPAEGCVPVERILEDVVGPLAKQSDLLLLVVDGLAYPIFCELRGGLEGLGWSEVLPAHAPDPAVGIAALPTVTEVSRASLLGGKLTSGAASSEKALFSSHPSLLGASKAAAKPVLFHKGDLGDGGGLSKEVRDAIGSTGPRVVAVVYNAVDDHLSGSNQLHLRWSLDDLRLIKPMLHEARNAGRTLVITADHGHVIDEKTTQRPAQDGDRWRARSGAIEADEILLEGGRVRTPAGANSVICAWSERLRYGFKKNGYHGGVSPQEVVVPLAVFVPPRVQIDHWKPAAPVQPDWWQDALPLPAGTAAPAVEQKTKKRAEPGQQDLFEATPRSAAATEWISLLLAAPAYQQQRQLAARVAPRDHDMRRMLEALDARGGKLSKAALAQRLDMPMVRVSGFVSAARRVLNLDQSPVLSLDESSGLVELNHELLQVQFQLGRR